MGKIGNAGRGSVMCCAAMGPNGNMSGKTGAWGFSIFWTWGKQINGQRVQVCVVGVAYCTIRKEKERTGMKRGMMGSIDPGGSISERTNGMDTWTWSEECRLDGTVLDGGFGER